MVVTPEQAVNAAFPFSPDGQSIRVPPTPSVERELLDTTLGACVEQVSRRAPDAPEAVKDEAVLRLYVFIVRNNVLIQSKDLQPTSRALATAFRSCGAASALAPWARRPAVSIG